MKTLKKLTALSIAVFAAATANAQDITIKNAAGAGFWRSGHHPCLRRCW